MWFCEIFTGFLWTILEDASIAIRFSWFIVEGFTLRISECYQSIEYLMDKYVEFSVYRIHGTDKLLIGSIFTEKVMILDMMIVVEIAFLIETLTRRLVTEAETKSLCWIMADIDWLAYWERSFSDKCSKCIDTFLKLIPWNRIRYRCISLVCQFL